MSMIWLRLVSSSSSQDMFLVEESTSLILQSTSLAIPKFPTPCPEINSWYWFGVTYYCKQFLEQICVSFPKYEFLRFAESLFSGLLTTLDRAYLHHIKVCCCNANESSNKPRSDVLKISSKDYSIKKEFKCSIRSNTTALSDPCLKMWRT